MTAATFNQGPLGVPGNSSRTRPLTGGRTRAFAGAASLIILIFLCAGSAKAVPLSDYHGRVRRAITLVGFAGSAPQSEEGGSKSVNKTAPLEEARKLLPEEETVEWGGRLLHVNNRWFAEALATYEGLPFYDVQRRTQWLARVTERLQALDERLSEMEARAGKASDKDEEKARLAGILRREEYNKQPDEGNALTRLWKRLMEWIRGLFPEGKNQERRSGSRAVNSTAQIIVAALSLVVIAYVAWRFLPRFLRRDMKKREKKKRGARVVLGEHLSMDESSSDLLTEAERLALSGDIRGAIRKGYIALLCELHDRKTLRLEQHKTNRDYLRAVEANRPLYEEMKPMTRSFESHWYGFTPADESDWQSFRAHYQKAVTSDE
jgi:hypothetical protein